MKKKSLSLAFASFLVISGILVRPTMDVSANPMNKVLPSSFSNVNKTPIAEQVAVFNDVSSRDLYYEEIEFLASKQIIKGFPEGVFRPELTITRAQVAIMIGRALELNGEQKETKFSDVTKNVSGSGYIASVVEKGIIKEFPDNTYRPYEPVTREQIAIFLDRAFDLTEYYFLANKIPDIDPNMEGYQSILNVYGNRIVDRYSDDSYRPNSTVTRGQFAAFLTRALEPSFRVAPTFAVDSIIDEENGTPNLEVDSDISWVIKFNNKVDWNSLRDNIYVGRESDNSHFTPNIDYYDPKSAIVKLHLWKLYDSDETYYLYIT